MQVTAKQEVRDRAWYEDFGRAVAESVAARVATITRGGGMSIGLRAQTWSVSMTLHFSDQNDTVRVDVDSMSRFVSTPPNFSFSFPAEMSAKRAGNAFAREVRKQLGRVGLVV
jgi:hypothetical protein